MIGQIGTPVYLVGENNQKYSTVSSQSSILEIRNNVYYCEFIIDQLLSEIEKNLAQVNVNAYASSELDSAHRAVWKDALKHSEKAKVINEPDYITFEEYVYASNHLCRSCRELVKQYDLIINHSSFGHLFEIKKILNYLKNETILIKNIVTHQFEERYRNESEGEIARELSDWTKAAAHYTKQIAQEITTSPSSIPQSELDQVSEKQAGQLQAFFSIKINSYTSEISSISNSLKRDCMDTASTFYQNYLLPAISFKSRVVEPLIFDFTTTSLGTECPLLLGEIVIANNSITGNLGSVSTDFIERKNQMEIKTQALMQLIVLKRRYVNYITQLEAKATQRTRVIIDKSKDENLQTYKDIYSDILINSENRENLRSSHSQLDDMEEDSHPQYLKKSGGTITGVIDFAPGAKIGGIDPSTHNHSGIDGSNVISAKSIDYESARDEYYSSGQNPYSNIKVTSFTQSLLTGGGISFDATLEIQIEDDKINSYEFEILYNEV